MRAVQSRTAGAQKTKRVDLNRRDGEQLGYGSEHVALANDVLLVLQALDRLVLIQQEVLSGSRQ